MTWLPIFRIGLWNAWIPMFGFFLPVILLFMLDNAVGKGQIYRKMGDVSSDPRQQTANTAATILLMLLVAYSIFLPLMTGTAWLYAGLLLWLAGAAIFLTAIITVATNPQGQVFTKGMYRFSRHPLYLSISAILAGTGVAAASWIFLLMALVYILLQNSQVKVEERDCLETFGDEYRDYMDRTPRWIGIPKIRRGA